MEGKSEQGKQTKNNLPAILLIGVLLLLQLLALTVGLFNTQQQLIVQIDSPNANGYLEQFRDLERNQEGAYRWSFSRAALQLHAFARTPVIVDLRLTSPRPADEPAAELVLARGNWRTPSFPIRGDWRRYAILIPATGYQPELNFEGNTFRPDERDRRSLGVALSRIQLQVAMPEPQFTSALSLVGFRRLLVLLILPLVCIGLVPAVRTQRTTLILKAIAGMLAVIGVYLLSSNLASFAYYLPAEFVPIVLAGMGLAVSLNHRVTVSAITTQLVQRLQNDAFRSRLLLATALVVGIIMAQIIPPWTHHDESSHFEYAWLAANHPTWPTPNTTDARLARIDGGGRALFHPPLYYAIASIPLRFVSSWTLEAQLLLVRLFSIPFLLLTVLMADRIVRELVPSDHVLRWMIPYVLVLNPSFMALMTSVNNDVAAVTACTWICWAMAQSLVQGLSRKRLIWLFGSAAIALLTKNTSAIVIGLIPIMLIICVWQNYRWRWRWLLSTLIAGGAALLLINLAWGDPAHWYRWGAATLEPGHRIVSPAAPMGTHVLRLNTVAVPDYEGLSQPIRDGERLSAQTVTVGAWIWASRPAKVWAPAIIYGTRDQQLVGPNRTIEVGTTPIFVADTFRLPQRLMFVHAMAWSVAPGDPTPTELYIDGVVFARGEFPAEPPTYSDITHSQGTWGGKPFVNLLINSDMEQGWIYLRPQVEQTVAGFARRSISRLVSNTADADWTLYREARDYVPWILFSLFGSYGERVTLRDPLWQSVIPGLFVLALAGIVRQVIRQPRPWDRRAIAWATLGFGCLMVWAVVQLVHLPPEFPSGIPLARYGYTVIALTMALLCAGWLAWIPQHLRRYGAICILIVSFVLLCLAYDTASLYANTACAYDPLRCAFTFARPAFPFFPQ